MQRPIGEAQLSGPLSRKISFFVAGRYVHRNQEAVIHALTDTGKLFENYPVNGLDDDGFGRRDFKLTNRKQLTLYYKYNDKSRGNQTVRAFHLPSRARDTLDRVNDVGFTG